MAQRFQKIYTTVELEEAHVIQALMRRNGVACWLLRNNGLSIETDSPSGEDGYKLFLPESQFQQGLAVFQKAFGPLAEAPYVGTLDSGFGGRFRNLPITQLVSDPLGPEGFIWNPPVGDPIGDAWKIKRPVCRGCGQEMATGDKFCDRCGKALGDTSPSEAEAPTCAKCGQEMPAGISQCFRCGEVR